MEKDFTVVAVGEEYSMFNIGKAKDADAAMVFEALPEKSGYAMNIYLSDITPQEAAIISSAPISVRILKDTSAFVLPVVRFGNSPIIFELIFDPKVYKDDRAMQLALDNNIVRIVGVDSRTNIVRALRMASMPKKLREVLLVAWTQAMQQDDFSEKYTRWTQDIASRYSLVKLWEITVYAGKFGEK
jgi:hypothetical protein